MAFLWAKNLGGDAASRLLSKFGLVDAVIDIACENQQWDFAMSLASGGDRSIIQSIQLKHAMFLEDEGQFPEAEACFIQAGKAKEAILMHIHNQDWIRARAVNQDTLFICFNMSR